MIFSKHKLENQLLRTQLAAAGADKAVLRDRTGEIDSVAKLIKEIAEQTNLCVAGRHS